MNFSGLTGTFNRIDAALGTLRTGVDLYTTNVGEMTRLHSAILQHASQSEDRLLFLMRLNQALFLELESVESERTTIIGTVPGLNDTIQQQQTTIEQLNANITNLNNQLTNITGLAQTEINNMQQRAESQLAVIGTLQANLNAANDRLSSQGTNLTNMFTRLQMLRTTRDNEIQALQQSLALRESLRNRLGDLDRERNDLQQMLSAVETVPLQGTVPPQTQPATGPGSRGGPGSRQFAGINPANTVPNKTRTR